MDIEQKRRDFIAYLDKEYSKTSFYYINLFGQNFLLCCDLVHLDGVTIKFLEEGKIEHGYPSNALKALKHMIVLSALSKIMVLVESFLRMTDALAKDFKKLPNKMMEYYPFKALDRILDRAKNGDISKDEIWTIFGFPFIGDLPLSDEEKDLIEKVLNHSVEQIKTFYERIARFYDDHRIAYNKFKHGLSVVVGLEPTETILNDPLILAMDVQKKIDRIRCQSFSSKVKLPAEYELFNIVSVIPVQEATFKKYSDILADLKNLIKAITDNHFIRGINCGTGYLPRTIHTEKDFPEDIFQKFQKIVNEKITPIMYIMKPPTFKFELKFEKPLTGALKSKLEKENVATVIMGETPKAEVYYTANDRK